MRGASCIFIDRIPKLGYFAKVTYSLFLTLHLIGVITWFAGLFYIFRLFVYHTEQRNNPAVCSVFVVMERKLYKIIMAPAATLTTLMGLGMLWQNPSILYQRWIWLKLAFVVVLFGYHVYSGYVMKRFYRGDFFLSSRQCRMINEVPSVVLLVVVPLVIFKPF
jgi:putative membrane protein